jgi:hypothetical protein
MPVGDETDPHSAAGIIAGQAGCLQLLLALFEREDKHNDDQEVLGCVVGTLLREPALDAYGLIENTERVLVMRSWLTSDWCPLLNEVGCT